ncbi:MAG: hypothetical protein JNL74_08760 [Fibrobacteres bacterium]|nr:hypothetical protein [Fibrobacterota bacterium]
MPLLLLLLVTIISAQDYISRQIPFTKEAMLVNSPNLINPSRFKMQQSYSMSYSTNGTENDLTGMYLNRMSYQFTVPLLLQVDVALMHKPMALFTGEPDPSGAKSALLGIPHAKLTWKPSEKFMMSVEYFQQQNGYSNNSLLSPFGNSLNPYSDDYFTPSYRKSR